jgi:hypothetical protein
MHYISVERQHKLVQVCSGWTVGTELCTLNCAHWTVGTELCTLNCAHWTVHTELWALNCGHWTVGTELCALNCGHWTVFTSDTKCQQGGGCSCKCAQPPQINWMYVAREHLNILYILMNCKCVTLVYFMQKVITSLHAVDSWHLNIWRYLMKVKAHKRTSLQYCWILPLLNRCMHFCLVRDAVPPLQPLMHGIVQCIVTGTWWSCSLPYQGPTVGILVVQDQDCSVHMATLSIKYLWWRVWCTH